jgi:hypothetical protein
LVRVRVRVMSSPEGVLPHTDTLSGAVERYSRWGWLVLRSENRLLLTTDHQVSVVEMAGGVGAEVQTYLALRMLGGPVVVLPGGSGRWLFLTSSADEASQVGLIRLRARGALTHRLGTLVPLPPSRIDRGVIGWLGESPVESVEKPFLPPFSAVVAALRAVAERP